MVLMIIIGVFVIAVLVVYLVALIKLFKVANSNEEINSKKVLFQWHFDKLLLAYKIKVLKDEIRARKVTMDELNEIVNESLGTKMTTKHVLDEIEGQVKGEVKQASAPKV